MKVKERLQSMKARLQKRVEGAFIRLHTFATDERGDTNFISIIVVLGIVLLVAGVFMVFKDQIIAKAQEIIGIFVIK